MNPLHQKAKQIAQQYKNCEQELLKIIMKIDQSKLFYQMGYNSLFKYIVEELKLSEAVAYNFVNVARKSHKVPELGRAVLTGKLSISKARKIVSVIEPQNQAQWIAVAKNKTQKQIEREVAMASPQKAITEKAIYIHPQDEVREKVTVKHSLPRVQLSMGVSEELMIQFRRAQDLESQRQKKNVGLEETLQAVLAIYLDKQDPVRKARRQKARGKLLTSSSDESASIEINSLDPMQFPADDDVTEEKWRSDPNGEVEYNLKSEFRNKSDLEPKSGSEHECEQETEQRAKQGFEAETKQKAKQGGGLETKRRAKQGVEKEIKPRTRQRSKQKAWQRTKREAQYEFEQKKSAETNVYREQNSTELPI